MPRFISKVRQFLHSTLGRSVTGLSTLVFLTWFLWPGPDWRINPEALAAFVIALITWITSMGAPVEKLASDHDTKLLEKFRALFSENEKTFLREHDLGNSFNWQRLDGTSELADGWRGAEFQFDDDAVQGKLSAIIQKAQKFIQDLSLGSQIINDRWASAVSDHERGSFFSKETEVRIDGYNKQATELADAIDDFIKYARKKLARQSVAIR